MLAINDLIHGSGKYPQGLPVYHLGWEKNTINWLKGSETYMMYSISFKIQFLIKRTWNYMRELRRQEPTAS